MEEELWEEEFIERCFQEMLDEEEEWEWFIPSRDLPSQSVSQLQEQISLLVLDGDKDLDVVVSLSPLPLVTEKTRVLAIRIKGHQKMASCQLTLFQHIIKKNVGLQQIYSKAKTLKTTTNKIK